MIPGTNFKTKRRRAVDPNHLTPATRETRWKTIRAKLKLIFEAAGYVRCEKCSGTFALSFAHRLKRRFITTEAELAMCVLLCQICHTTIEHSGHEQMYQTVTQMIENRTHELRETY